ncbi:Lnb N-terminal periplasmic domain-containing protein [Solidesulfovibrio sp.]
MNRRVVLAARILAVLAVALMTGWAALAVYWSDIPGPTTRGLLAAGVVLATVLAFALTRRRARTLAAYCLAFGLFVLWWSTIEPSNDRDWQPDVAVLPYGEMHGDSVTVRNIRNFAYRTDTEYAPRYYDKTFDLSRLTAVDLIAVYWMGEAIAHVMLSFDFAGQDGICLSIETRKERGEDYSSIMGFFKQYEIIYIAADERDLIRLRTEYRRPPEDVYLYRTRLSPENARKLFLEYVREMNRLRGKPEFYNTLTTNCTTNIVRHFRAFGDTVRYNWKILFSGYTPLYAYELGGLDDAQPFEELRAKSYVNPKAREAGDAPDFSARIRLGLPGMEASRAP